MSNVWRWSLLVQRADGAWWRERVLAGVDHGEELTSVRRWETGAEEIERLRKSDDPTISKRQLKPLDAMCTRLSGEVEDIAKLLVPLHTYTPYGNVAMLYIEAGDGKTALCGAMLDERLAMVEMREGSFLVPWLGESEAPEPDPDAIQRVSDVIAMRREITRRFPVGQ